MCIHLDSMKSQVSGSADALETQDSTSGTFYVLSECMAACTCAMLYYRIKEEPDWCSSEVT